MRARYQIDQQQFREQTLTVEISMTVQEWRDLAAAIKDVESRTSQQVIHFQWMVRNVIDKAEQIASSHYISTPYNTTSEGPQP